MKDQARILPRKLIYDGGDDARGNDNRGPDPQFPRGRIGKELDVLHRLPQLIEYDETAVENRAPIDRRLDAVRAPVEETHAQSVLHVGDRF